MGTSTFLPLNRIAFLLTATFTSLVFLWIEVCPFGFRSEDWTFFSPPHQRFPVSESLLVSAENSTDPTPLATIVTYFAAVNKSKHSLVEYRSWSDNFLRIQSPIVLYCPQADCGDIIKRRNKSFPLKVIRLNHWDTPIATGMRKAYESQHNIDPEGELHSPDLYAIWNNKAFLLSEVASTNPFNTLYFFWVDFGTFRLEDSPYSEWPSPEMLNATFFGHKSKILLSAVSPPQPSTKSTEKTDPQYWWNSEGSDGIQGNIFGGLQDGVRNWSKVFYHTLKESFDEGFFIGKDQNIMNKAAMSNPETAILFPSYKANENCGNLWYRLIWYLAKPSEQAMDTSMHGNCSVHPVSFTDVIGD